MMAKCYYCGVETSLMLNELPICIDCDGLSVVERNKKMASVPLRVSDI
jgi:hypothetical protein